MSDINPFASTLPPIDHTIDSKIANAVKHKKLLGRTVYALQYMARKLYSSRSNFWDSSSYASSGRRLRFSRIGKGSESVELHHLLCDSSRYKPGSVRYTGPVLQDPDHADDIAKLRLLQSRLEHAVQHREQLQRTIDRLTRESCREKIAEHGLRNARGMFPEVETYVDNVKRKNGASAAWALDDLYYERQRAKSAVQGQK